MPPKPTGRNRAAVTLAVLALVAAALYGATLLRFGVMIGGGQ
ncbi:MAG: hypothetical protein ACM31D_03845 [Bacteroidota bacterium]